jgi:hypothetical protein
MLAIEITPELDLLIEEYEKTFVDLAPAHFMGSTTAERIARIRKCIETKTPDLEAKRLSEIHSASGYM